VTEIPDLEQNPIIAKIRGWRPEAVAGLVFFRGELTVVIYREHLLPLAEFLCTDPGSAFTYLSDVTGVDRFPIEPRFELNYHLLSLSRRETIRIRVRLPGDGPVVQSVIPVWESGLKATPTCGACCSLMTGKAIHSARTTPWRVLADFQSH
jgi:NADH-quinone oxidoreductase subunit C